jgi:hypothetical protein
MERFVGNHKEKSSEASSFMRCRGESEEEWGCRECLTQRQWQERDWVQILCRLVDILLRER